MDRLNQVGVAILFIEAANISPAYIGTLYSCFQMTALFLLVVSVHEIGDLLPLDWQTPLPTIAPSAFKQLIST